MIVWAIAMIVAGVVAGIFAPILFVIALAGVVLLILAVVRGRGARAPNPPE
jgi:hypothetical protein